MIPLPEPSCRAMPVDISIPVRNQILAGRVRMLHLPGPRAAFLQTGDCLWVREMFRVLPSGAGLIDVTYGSEQVRSIRWPAVLPRPSIGVHMPEAMPVHLSRMTLIVLMARTIRLQQVNEDDACAAGVILHRDGFGHDWAPVAEWPGALEAYGRRWDLWHGAEGPICWGANPELREITFRAVTRNIGDLLPGIGP